MVNQVEPCTQNSKLMLSGLFDEQEVYAELVSQLRELGLQADPRQFTFVIRDQSLYLEGLVHKEEQPHALFSSLE